MFRQIREGYEPKIIQFLREKVAQLLSDSETISANAAHSIADMITDRTTWRDVRAMCQRLYTTAVC